VKKELRKRMPKKRENVILCRDCKYLKRRKCHCGCGTMLPLCQSPKAWLGNDPNYYNHEGKCKMFGKRIRERKEGR